MAALIITLTKDDNDDGNNKALNPKTVLFLFTVCVCSLGITRDVSRWLIWRITTASAIAAAIPIVLKPLWTIHEHEGQHLGDEDPKMNSWAAADYFLDLRVGHRGL